MKKENYSEKEKLKTARELILKKKKYNLYLSEYALNNLSSLIALEKSVFNFIPLYDCLHEVELFYDIAKFNLCNKTVKTIEELKDSIDQDKLTAIYNQDEFIVSYNYQGNCSIDIIKFNFSRRLDKIFDIIDVMPYIYLCKCDKMDEDNNIYEK